MAYKEEQNRAKLLAVQRKETKQIINTLRQEFRRFNDLSDDAQKRNVYRWIKENNTEFSNWIDKHKARYGKYPIVPKRLGVLIQNYHSRMRVSKRLKLKKAPPSMQYWQCALKPSERTKFLELIQWLGQEPEDYETLIRRYIPGRNDVPKVLPKRKTI